MKDVRPICARTVVHKTTREWLPATFGRVAMPDARIEPFKGLLNWVAGRYCVEGF